MITTISGDMQDLFLNNQPIRSDLTTPDSSVTSFLADCSTQFIHFFKKVLKLFDDIKIEERI